MVGGSAPGGPGAPAAARGTEGLGIGASGGCRFCGEALSDALVDLGTAPCAREYLSEADLRRPELAYPVSLHACGACGLVQLPGSHGHDRPPRLNSFASFSEARLAAARDFAAAVRTWFALGPGARVVEVGSNDGYLLRYFAGQEVPPLGVEPAANVAEAARAAGVDTREAAFGATLARELVAEGYAADLLVANGVLAQALDLNDFVEGLHALLAPEGVASIEVHDLHRLLERNELDRINHEHQCYFSLLTAERVLQAHALRVFDAEELEAGGGRLRLLACREGSRARPRTARLERLEQRERTLGLDDLDTYRRFGARIQAVKEELLTFLLRARREGAGVVGYGAPATATALLAYCGVREDLVRYVVDRDPRKQGAFLPGSRIPIHDPARVALTRPDYLLILPWDLRDEVVRDMALIRDWGGRFVTASPSLRVVEDAAPAPAPVPGTAHATSEAVVALQGAGVEVHHSALAGEMTAHQTPPRVPCGRPNDGRAGVRVRARLRDTVRAAARSGLGTRLIAVAVDDPTVRRRLAVRFSDRQAAHATFAAAMPRAARERSAGFAGCAWLFSSNHLNHGLARLRFDEAAYLYRLTASLGGPRACEIGRFQGGTTFLLAHAGARVLSVDLDLEAQATRAIALVEALQGAGLRERVHLVVGDSRAYPVAPGKLDLLFVDGDHSREGVMADVAHWWPALRPGGHALFHDATRQFPWVAGVADALEEIVRRPDVAQVREAPGTLAHLVKA